MALAWLDLIGVDRGALRFAIDTGTNRYYQLRVGRSRANRDGFEWVDGIYLSTRVKGNDAGGSLLPATREVALPASRLDGGDAYVQLVTYKTPDGRGSAYSRVIQLPPNAQSLGGGPLKLPFVMPVSASMTLSQAPFQTPRKVPCAQSPNELAHETSLDDLLGGIVKVAAPIVLQLLGSGSGGGSGGSAGGAAAGGDAGSTAGGIVSFLLKTLLSGLGQPAAAAPATPAVAKQQSLGATGFDDNRFLAAKRTEYARPFIFGVDDALIAALAGPILKVLPELLNSANNARLQTRQADNKLISDALAGINQRLLVQQIQDAQQKASGDQAAQLAQLAQLLQQAQANAPANGAKSQSLSFSDASPATPPSTPSKRAVLDFVTADPVAFNGKKHVLFVRGHDAEFKVRFTVGDPVPKTQLARAILALTFKGTHHPADWVTVSTRLNGVAPNSVVTASVTQADLAKLPANRKIDVIAQLRWPDSRGGRAVHCATGCTEVVLVDKYFVKERGAAVGAERELTDMGRFRPFWNRIWETPSLDSVNQASGGRPKSLWELDVDARYFVLLKPREQSNAVMETKVRTSPPDPDALRLTIDGKLKSGVELSMSELNKLCTLWDGESPLDADHLAALTAEPVAHAASGEFVSHINLKGRAGEHGIVWVVPAFQLVEFTLGTVQTTDDAGQVVAAGEEKVRYPLPVAARILGIKSST